MKRDGAFWLTSNQIQVSQLVARGKTDKEIANLRGCTDKAVKDMLCRLYRRIGLEGPNSRLVLAVLVWKWGLLGMNTKDWERSPLQRRVRKKSDAGVVE